MMEYIRNLLSGRRERTEDGASAVEYGLLIAGIAAVVAVAIFAFSGTITGLFNDTCNSVNDTTTGCVTTP
jgi:pilus assembly protein Flp/PilA